MLCAHYWAYKACFLWFFRDFPTCKPFLLTFANLCFAFFWLFLLQKWFFVRTSICLLIVLNFLYLFRWSQKLRGLDQINWSVCLFFCVKGPIKGLVEESKKSWHDEKRKKVLLFFLHLTQTKDLLGFFWGIWAPVVLCVSYSHVQAMSKPCPRCVQDVSKNQSDWTMTLAGSEVKKVNGWYIGS